MPQKIRLPLTLSALQILVRHLRILLAALLSGDRYGHRSAIAVADRRRGVFLWKTALVSEGVHTREQKVCEVPAQSQLFGRSHVGRSLVVSSHDSMTGKEFHVSDDGNRLRACCSLRGPVQTRGLLFWLCKPVLSFIFTLATRISRMVWCAHWLVAKACQAWSRTVICLISAVC